MNPVTSQPAADNTQWSNVASSGDCPPGLEHLVRLDQVLCQQRVEMCEAMTGYSTNNQYKILNNQGQQIYSVQEDSTFCQRFWCKSLREFTMKVFDNNQQEIMRIHRPYVCCGNCCWLAGCLSYQVTVEAPVGTVIGVVNLKQSWCTYRYDVCDSNGKSQLDVNGPCMACSCCPSVEYSIDSRGQEVGSIKKKWGGVLKEAMTNADNYSVQFPVDMDVKLKATLFGALFFIEFMAYEQQMKSQKDF